MAKLPIRESRKGREGILVRAQEANGEIRWPAYRAHKYRHAQTHTQKMGKHIELSYKGLVTNTC